MQDQNEYSSRPPMQPPVGAAKWSPYPIFGVPGEIARDRQPRGCATAAWFVIIISIAVFMGLRFIGERLETNEGAARDELGIVLMELQGKYAVGASSMSDPGMLYSQMKEGLNKGSIDQRQRFVVLAGEMKGREEAAEVLRELEDDIAEQTRKRGSEAKLITQEQEQVQEILHKLYAEDARSTVLAPQAQSASDSHEAGPATTAPASTAPDSNAPFLERITDQEQTILKQQLGWFGRLALTPAGQGTPSQRSAVLNPARIIFGVLLGGAMVAAVVGIVGFIVLVIMLVMAFTRNLRGGVLPSQVHHGMYAETFAAWFVLFMALNIGGQLLGWSVPQGGLLIALAAFFGSLLALGWPVLRGMPWSIVRRDIGWTLGRQPGLEPLLGPAGYVMGLPILALGVLMTLALVLVQQAFAPAGQPLDPATGPAHPIVKELVGAGWAIKLQLVMLGSIAAPIVEETMFRGVLYRHLRDGSAKWGAVASILFATAVNSVIFAIIHPQGWVAWPALASLAVSFSLMREWRGTLIPAMIMHGIQNGIVFGMLIFILSLS